MLPLLGSLSTVSLIFGGCCSNVFVLEAIIKSEPDSGLLITFFQFLFTALAAYPTQFSASGPYNVKQPTIPLRKWAFIALMFYSVNMLNNWAFAFNISVPIHIVLRSFGSVTTMLAGWIKGRRYSWLQVTSVGILTLGVLVSAWADAEGKGKSMSATSESGSNFATGLAVLLLAQILSAYMGVYVQETYATYGADWKENLFYSHFLSLPFFLPLSGSLRRQYARLSSTHPLDMSTRPLAEAVPALRYLPEQVLGLGQDALSTMPRGLLFLLINAFTQLVCISGVNLLSAKASAVTVTIVLNVRKLVSFIFSTYLFGHHLTGKMIIGAMLVFGSGALYGWETSWRLPQSRAKATKTSQDRAKR